MSVSLGDFQLINTWKLDENTTFSWNNFEPVYLIDNTTNKKYWNESKNCVRTKCFLLTLGTPIVHAITSLVNVIYRIIKLVSLSHFWMDKEGETSSSLKGRAKDAGQDLLRVLIAPITFVFLELAAIFGMFTPYNGRKLYASIERGLYGRAILAPCFQPDPQRHFFGGDPLKQNAY